MDSQLLSFEADQRLLRDFDAAIRREWLEVNGLGGWASSTICGAHSRRYHGLLIAALDPPAQRVSLLSRLDETIVLSPLRFELGCNQYPGTIYPHGHWRLERFTRQLFPCYEFKIGEVSLKKTIAMCHGENTTLVLYEVSGPDQTPFTIELEPLVVAREIHALAVANDRINADCAFEDGILEVHPYPGLPKLFISVEGASFEKAPVWHLGVEYKLDQERGIAGKEDVFSYGKLIRTLQAGLRLGVIISAEPPHGRDAFELFQQEQARKERLLAKAPKQTPWARTLTLAADQFIVQRAERGRTIIAGYPWFTDWGRDTMISLPGLCCVTSRFEEARRIFLTFREQLHNGLLPNCFSERGSQPAFNTADASLWLFEALQQYEQHSGDKRFVAQEMLPALLQIIEHHQKGTLYHIKQDQDGLLCAGARDVPLSWMDVKIGTTAATPRYGKLVEVNALWINALLIVARLCEDSGRALEASKLGQQASQARQSYEKVFWNADLGYLYDYVTPDYSDTSFRPNQIISLGLSHPIVSEKIAKRVLTAVQERLLTPQGLRTLEPGHKQYRPRYAGDQGSREEAYHQGTVWLWLLGPYSRAVMRYGTDQQKQGLGVILNDFDTHLNQSAIGSLYEIADGDQPHYARGCPFQAWSVAEILRARTEL